MELIDDFYAAKELISVCIQRQSRALLLFLRSSPAAKLRLTRKGIAAASAGSAARRDSHAFTMESVLLVLLKLGLQRRAKAVYLCIDIGVELLDGIQA